MWRCLLLIGALLSTRPAAAEVPSPDRDPVELDRGTRALGVAASIVPGALLHGAGHWVIGRERAAGRLLALEGAGLALIVAGALPLVFTRANRYLTGPMGTLAIVGGAMFSTSWIVDTTAAAWPLATRGEPRRDAARVLGELGYRYLRHAAFDRDHAVVARLDTRLGPMRISPELWTMPQGPEARWRLEAAYRAWGPTGTVASGDGSWMELELGVMRHRFSEGRFAMATADAMAQARVDWARIDPHLRGFFFEVGIGVGWQRFLYDRAPDDDATLLLGRFASGLWLGRPDDGPWAEVMGYYDHRHDDVAGGISEIGLGVPGFFGLDARIWPVPEAGIRLSAEAGTAIVAGGSLLVRGWADE